MNGESAFRTKLKGGITAGLKKGWDGFVWMMKIIIPISLFTDILKNGPNPTTTHKIELLMPPVSVSDERDKPDDFSSVSMRQGR
jgi:hypothetical protein